jgi:hypothetical protein
MPRKKSSESEPTATPPPQSTELACAGPGKIVAAPDPEDDVLNEYRRQAIRSFEMGKLSDIQIKRGQSDQQGPLTVLLAPDGTPERFLATTTDEALANRYAEAVKLRVPFEVLLLRKPTTDEMDLLMREIPRPPMLPPSEAVAQLPLGAVPRALPAKVESDGATSPRFPIGSRVHHAQAGSGTVRGYFDDGRTSVDLDSETSIVVHNEKLRALGGRRV